MNTLLRRPEIYQFFQVAVGAFSARASLVHQYLDPQPGQRLIDIGCGTGHILGALPEGVRYDGFDIDRTYIDFANRHFGRRAKFHCRLFDRDAASEFGPADIVMMNGVLHHMDDDSARVTISAIETVLKIGGTLFTLDPVYVPGQSAIVKWFLDNDRGKFVRSEAPYRALLSGSFSRCELHLYHHLFRIPYDVVISKCIKSLPN